ncbi:MAG TPA: SPW repeat protein [Myxococcaceae bacterium]|nr:SPW repeat protein [Myxococcaceae bacterium]
MWARWSNVVLSAWLIVAPFILGYDVPAARVNSVTLGMGIFLVALIAEVIPPVRFLNTAMGVWLILAPFLLGYGDELAPTLNDIIVGILVAALSLVPARWGALRAQRGARA